MPRNQFRMLNRRKGPAVRGPRAQADRKLYAAAMQTAINETANLVVIEPRRTTCSLPTSRVTGSTVWPWPPELSAGAVVITTGTFCAG